ncbi:MAG: hypothetical protein JWO72_1292, partial [Caulobacteraceae bacterium]|nr:hypothetical protein [Caulobacteraceae bacterium]
YTHDLERQRSLQAPGADAASALTDARR